MSNQPPPPEPEMDIDFGDEPTPPVRNSKAPFPAQRAHPADEEYQAPVANRSRVNGSHKEESKARILPHDTDSEVYLISCCFVDGRDVVARCIEAKIDPKQLHGTTNQILLGCIYSCYNRDIEIAVGTVAAELRSTKQFDEIGGMSFLLEISGKCPTTAQTSFFIENVRSHALLRETIKLAARITEEAYANPSDVHEFLTEQQERLKRVAAGSSATRSEQVAARAFDLKKQIPKPDAIYSLAGTTVSTPGNLTAIYSQAKTGKSSLIGAMIAAAMTNPTSGHDTLGIIGPNYAKKALLHFDTEQSPYDWQQLVKSSLKRVGLDAPPPWLMSYTLTGLSAHECRDFIKASMKRALKLHKGIHSVIIDGIADLVVDPNDAAECFPFLTELHGSAIEFNTAIISVLHMNPGSEVKGRGHLGSQLERKAESNLTLEKTGEVTAVWSTKQRGKGISKEKAPSFAWSEEHQMHRTCATPGITTSKPRANLLEKYKFSEFKTAFPEKHEVGRNAADVLRRSGVPLHQKGFYDLIRSFVAEGMVEEMDSKERGKTYRLAV